MARSVTGSIEKVEGAVIEVVGGVEGADAQGVAVVKVDPADRAIGSVAVQHKAIRVGCVSRP